MATFPIAPYRELELHPQFPESYIPLICPFLLFSPEILTFNSDKSPQSCIYRIALNRTAVLNHNYADGKAIV